MSSPLFERQYAVVAGVDINGLGVLRSLGRAGVPLVALDTETSKATLRTRYATKMRVRALSGTLFVEDLLKIRRHFRRKPVLILTQEASVFTALASEELKAEFRFTMPQPDVMTMLLDKRLFQSEAQRRGFLVPRAARLNAQSDSTAATKLRFPCVLKPTTKVKQYGDRFAKAYRVSDMAEVIRLWGEMRSVIDEAILQEWIEGGDEDVYFCLQYRGAVPTARRSFVGRKLLQWPPLVGGTAICIPAPEVSQELIAVTEAFFESVGFVGLGSMEYKRDRRDRKFYMIEPTVGRTDYQEEVASLNGVNIPYSAYRAELGELPPPQTPNRFQTAWRDPISTYNAIQVGAADPLRGRGSTLRVCDAYFRWDDPGPYLALKAQSANRRLTRIGSALGLRNS